MKQGNREKLSVTIEPRLYQAVERYAKRAKLTRSQVIEEAIRVWERSRLVALAREGYRETAAEDVADAEAYLPVTEELGGE